MTRNGFVPITQLKRVAPGTMLATSSANAFLNLVLIARMLDDTKVTPVATYGSGYRDFACQTVFWRASRGDRSALEQAGLDLTSKITVSAPGGSSHGLGTRIDMFFNGRSPDADDLSLAKRYGWTREWGAADRNHFMHDRKTAISGVRAYDQFRILGRFYNAQHLGHRTETAHTGKPDETFVWLVQAHGRNTGTYPEPYKHDAIGGPKTKASMLVDWRALKAAA